MALAVAAPNPIAVRAALDVSGAGGSVVDAAIAAMLTTMATEPGMVSPLAGGFVSTWFADADPEVIDGNVEMPGRGLPIDRFGTGLRPIAMDYGGGIEVLGGLGSAATPGAVAAFGAAQARHGRVPWSQVLAPAVAAARSGYPLGAAAASYLAICGTTLYGWDRQTAALVLTADGTPKPAGTIIRDGDLADSLEHLGRAGAADLYTGELARTLVADMVDRDGLITLADLAAYRAVRRNPVRRTLGQWVVATNPPPSIGGPMLAVMLGELDRRSSLDWSQVIAIQRQVLTYRRGTHDYSTDLESDGYALLDTVTGEGLAALTRSPSTAHVSVVDDLGNACATTCSSGYGSGATVPGTGLMVNNCLGEPELNRRGVHALAPGTRLASNMAPTVLRAPDRQALAIGSPGADRITTALMQVLGRFALDGLSLQASIDRPRLHVKVNDDLTAVIEYEADEQIARAAADTGLPTVEHSDLSMYFGGVGAVLRLPDGSLEAGADPRRESAIGIG